MTNPDVVIRIKQVLTQNNVSLTLPSMTFLKSSIKFLHMLCADRHPHTQHTHTIYHCHINQATNTSNVLKYIFDTFNYLVFRKFIKFGSHSASVML